MCNPVTLFNRTTLVALLRKDWRRTGAEAEAFNQSEGYCKIQTRSDGSLNLRSNGGDAKQLLNWDISLRHLKGFID